MIHLEINGEPKTLDVAPRELLLHTLRSLNAQSLG